MNKEKQKSLILPHSLILSSLYISILISTSSKIYSRVANSLFYFRILFEFWYLTYLPTKGKKEKDPPENEYTCIIKWKKEISTVILEERLMWEKREREINYLLNFHFAAAGTSTGGKASCFQPARASNALK